MGSGLFARKVRNGVGCRMSVCRVYHALSGQSVTGNVPALTSSLQKSEKITFFAPMRKSCARQKMGVLFGNAKVDGTSVGAIECRGQLSAVPCGSNPWRSGNVTSKTPNWDQHGAVDPMRWLAVLVVSQLRCGRQDFSGERA